MHSGKCKINFECPEPWEGLNKTDDPLVRHCDKCAKDVHYCATEGELELADEEWCVAVPVDVLGGSEVMMGDIDFVDFKDQFSEPQPEDFEPKPCDIEGGPSDQFLDVESDAKK